MEQEQIAKCERQLITKCDKIGYKVQQGLQSVMSQITNCYIDYKVAPDYKRVIIIFNTRNMFATAQNLSILCNVKNVKMRIEIKEKCFGEICLMATADDIFNVVWIERNDESK